MNAFLSLLVVLSLLSPAPEATRKRSINFAWHANLETDLGGYNFYEHSSPGYTPLATIAPAPVPTFSITTKPPRGIHYYVVTAFNTAGKESDYSAEVSYTVGR